MASGRLSPVWILLSGSVCEMLSFQHNLGRFGNSLAIWLGMHPAEIFPYIFLPPLLFHSAMCVDFFTFKKVLMLSLVFAFLLMVASIFLSTPLMLFGLGLYDSGWSWAHVALFNVMVASTDAVAVRARLKGCGGGASEMLGAFLEGESLFSSANALVLFDVFFRRVAALSADDEGVNGKWLSLGGGRGDGLDDVSSPSVRSRGLSMAGVVHTAKSLVHHPNLSPLPRPPPPPPPPLLYVLPDSWYAAAMELKTVALDFSWLVVSGVVVGLLFGIATSILLKWMQWRRLGSHTEVLVTLTGAYLCFFITNASLGASGAVAVLVYGLYGATSLLWGISLKARREGWVIQFWTVLSNGISGLVYFLVGASSTNFIVRLGRQLTQDPNHLHPLLIDTLSKLPVVFFILFFVRGVLILGSCTMVRKLSGHAELLDWKGAVLTTIAALRGSVPLILGQIVLIASMPSSPSPPTLSPPGFGYSSSSSSLSLDSGFNASSFQYFLPSSDGQNSSSNSSINIIINESINRTVNTLDTNMTSLMDSTKKPSFPSFSLRSNGSKLDLDDYVAMQMVIWTIGVVLLTRLVNASLINPLITWLGYDHVSSAKQKLRTCAQMALVRFTAAAIETIRNGGDEMLRGVDWTSVAYDVDFGG
eukprot:CAMPEP_0175040062 /NCGR_PEP_ID=MMETSP0052_2-20121109/1021_1 /TAXON_ID=51329 ORGANISM="Polytomella parva, Strain SAG 63-3" /NCGR_SAMPLE_ID=MMETSP0052_2 /ASSEMBLY_ACC=CAM_ASM_000194 /LENGTH=644 /DNA_ID=CAMNT_0016302165 /DNA_START=218 /DNA_END=2148 /DNA_ORIENTATION=-